LFTQAFTTVLVAGGLGNAFARSRLNVAVKTRAANTSGFQPVQSEFVCTVFMGE
jgi:hypothetical protein